MQVIRISAKGRYALASMAFMASSGGDAHITVISISQKLGISKIYLEQVFALLKRSGLVLSVKGAQGGYRLRKAKGEITVYDILEAVEAGLFERAEATVEDTAPEIEQALQDLVFSPLDLAAREQLCGVTLEDLVAFMERHRVDAGPMFYI